MKKSKASEGHHQKLDKLKHGLRSWVARTQADRKKDDPNLAELIDTKIQLNLEIDKDECYWEQRACINWLKYGDRNTAFFHSQATHRRRRNLFHKLQDEEGRETEIIQDMEGTARSYFQNLFMLEERGSCDHLLSRIDRCISEKDNQFLTALYTKEEIKEAVFEMGPTKALGKDGLPALFYQKCWHIIGNDVIKFCLQILNEDKGFKQVNSTHIILIPTVANLVNMKRFKPISLFNVIFKIMAKAIANRLRRVIEKCIDVAQSAFVLGRLILNNVLLAYEILHTLKQKRVGQIFLWQ
ncbi:reverse transcriptase [Gossypium australe]|uniref:Reverse transcriptase n=1 Tax=Gossypium australe TaxID=47621 RepID=A0A5B6VF23_9ROSI|nr:reverse transcriptase [Gossypium australe]